MCGRKTLLPLFNREKLGVWAAIGAWVLAACAPTSHAIAPSSEPYREPKETCNANAALAVVKGKKSSPAIEHEAMRTATATSVRTLHKDDMITREYKFGRLNLVVNDARVIESANCG
ncbi:MAG: I78 family peptidase inhibitor [Brachymonas sp.]|nr:I78 family peptidase inhibitor [Brachymonas sp.]